MPTHTRLARRGSRYYLRVAVPADLRHLLGWEITRSLRTSDYATARRKINLESERADRIIAEARATVAPTKQPSPSTDAADAEKSLVVTSEREAEDLAKEWLIKRERDGSEWWENEGVKLDGSERNDVLSDLWHHKAALTGEAANKIHPANTLDGSEAVSAFLASRRETLSPQSAAFELLRQLFRRAEIEHYRRQMDRVEGKGAVVYDARFQDAFAHSAPPTRRRSGPTIKGLCEQLIASYERAGKAPKTILQYRVTAALLQDVFGAQRDAGSIGHADVEAFCDLIENLPVNAKKKYPGLTARQTIDAARAAKDFSRLDGNTRRNRFFCAFTTFKFGVEINELPSNPFDNRLLKERFQTVQKHGVDKRAPFSEEQLRKIFTAPLYTGCRDDEAGYAKPGPNVVRRARFFVPLIGLFHGMRLNEICQLYTEDVKDWEKGFYFDIRPDLDGGRSSDKRLKNSASRRHVPVHPELIKMGFADYVKARRRDASNPRLFPELKISESGSYADGFSKWFQNFLRNTFGEKQVETFHSFRHTFADAIRRTDASDRHIDRLCGWAGNASRQSAHYGENRDLEGLYAALTKISYPFSLVHLYGSAGRCTTGPH